MKGIGVKKQLQRWSWKRRKQIKMRGWVTEELMQTIHSLLLQNYSNPLTFLFPSERLLVQQ
jgi:hypothetical protein